MMIRQHSLPFTFLLAVRAKSRWGPMQTGVTRMQFAASGGKRK